MKRFLIFAVRSGTSENSIASDASDISSILLEKEDADIFEVIDRQKNQMPADKKHEFLPMNEFIEFLRDLKETLESNKSFLLGKMSQFLINKVLQSASQNSRSNLVKTGDSLP